MPSIPVLIPILIKVDNYLLKNTVGLTTCKELIFVPEMTTIDDLLKIIGLSKNLVSFITVNGVRQDLEYKLKYKDEIAFYPYISGG